MAPSSCGVKLWPGIMTGQWGACLAALSLSSYGLSYGFNSWHNLSSYGTCLAAVSSSSYGLSYGFNVWHNGFSVWHSLSSYGACLAALSLASFAPSSFDAFSACSSSSSRALSVSVLAALPTECGQRYVANTIAAHWARRSWRSLPPPRPPLFASREKKEMAARHFDTAGTRACTAPPRRHSLTVSSMAHVVMACYR